MHKPIIHQGISESEVREIARKFFEQHYSVSIENADLEGRVWQVEVILSAFGQQTRKLKIDAESGKIVNIE